MVLIPPSLINLIQYSPVTTIGKQDNGRIFYLGAPIQFTWGDYGSGKGFHTFDTETKKLVFYQNHREIFKKIHYNANTNPEDFAAWEYQDTIVKVIVQEKNDPFAYDQFLDQLDKINTAKLSIDDAVSLQLEETEIKEGDTTLQLINNSIDQMDDSIDKAGIKMIVNDLYQEALMLE